MKKANRIENRDLATKMSYYECATLLCVYKIVKQKDGEGALCMEVMEMLKKDYGKEYRDTTVYTYLKHLNEKGFLTQERKGLTRYTPIMEEDEIRKIYLENFVKMWYSGNKEAIEKEIKEL